MRHVFSMIAIAALCAAPVAAQVVDLDRPAEEGPAKPEIWTKATEDAAKAAEESARKDACVRLVEAAYRLPVGPNRDVLDMLMKNAAVDKDLLAGLAGAKPVHAEYRDDGSVLITVTTTPAEVRDILKKAYANVDWDRQEEDATIAAVATLTKPDEAISAEGEGALAASTGEKRIPVRRAARRKAEVEMAGEFAAMLLGSAYGKAERVRDFCEGIPEAKKKFALGLATTRIRLEEWKDDGSVVLRAEIVGKPVADALARARALYDREGRYARLNWGDLQNNCAERIVQGVGRAKPGDPVPDNAPLAVETQAVDEAMKKK